jgi:outer membrane biosynthesis protein TonB
VARAAAISLGAVERREFRRLLVVSAALHAVLALFLGYSASHEVVMPQGVIAVELVALPAAAPAPAPARAAPRPAPPPPPPVPDKVVLPKEPTPPAARPKAEPKPAPKPAPAAEPAPEKDLSDVLSVSPEFLAWERRARIHIRQSWVVPPSFRNQPLRTTIVVELSSTGEVVGEPRVVKRSGNPWYDDGVVRSIQKASPLPAPPEAGDWSFVFVADESE